MMPTILGFTPSRFPVQARASGLARVRRRAETHVSFQSGKHPSCNSYCGSGGRRVRDYTYSIAVVRRSATFGKRGRVLALQQGCRSDSCMT
jgi:hypothetical protein